MEVFYRDAEQNFCGAGEFLLVSLHTANALMLE